MSGVAAAPNTAMTDRPRRGRLAVVMLSLAVATAANLAQVPALQAQSLTPEQVQSLAQAREETRIDMFRQAVAEAASKDAAIATFYQTNGYTPIWTGDSDADTARRRALMMAIAEAPAHGLPAARYDGPALMEAMRKARTPRELGLLEVELSRSLLRIARDLHSGILVPSEVDRGIVRKVTYQDRFSVLNAFSTSNPATFFRALAPATAEYNRLMKEKMRLEALMAVGGWGPTVGAKALKPGESGPDVIALRNRLVAMGYLDRSASVTYDGTIQAAVQTFQVDHGLTADGVAGASTLSELNIPVEDRLKSVIVAMERERWLGAERGKRHILVNLTDFQSKIIDDDKITFQTRSVIGAVDPAKRTPEFSDLMTYLEINPDWTVPTGIIQRDYLPALQRNPNALSHLQVTDARGRVIPRGNIDFSR